MQKEQQQWFLWVPVAFAVGVIVYFYLSTEPSWTNTIAIVLVGIGLVVIGHRTVIGLLMSGLIFWCAIGFMSAKIRTLSVEAPVITKSKSLVTLTGWVEKAQKGGDGILRITLYVHLLKTSRGTQLSYAKTPKRVRLSIRHKGVVLNHGAFISVKAVLKPPPRPLWPGGFDYARVLWFKQIGGIGYVTAPPEMIVQGLPDIPWHLMFHSWVDAFRSNVKDSIRTTVPDKLAPVAIALVTGDRSEIPENDLQALRDSGLAHILAISGLHMAIMAGTIYFLFRSFLAIFPSIALNYPIKSIAAVCAIVGGGFYLVISGAAVSTQRAYFMTLIMLLAIILNRPAISMRNVAIAALFILTLKPESILDVGFQMSFAAVIALVAIYEMMTRDRARKKREGRILMRPTIFPVRYLSGVVSTTLIAGIAVAPIAAFHFHKLSQFSLLGNVLAMPATALIVMPMALLTFVLMPFGLEAYPLYVMSYGLSWLMSVADYVSRLPGATRAVAKMSDLSFALILCGGLWLVIWKSWWRFYGLFVVAAGLVFMPFYRLPDLIVDEEAKVVAVKQYNGLLTAPAIRKGDFHLSKWLKIYGDERPAQLVRKRNSFKCDHLSCVTQVRGLSLSFLKHPHALSEDCGKADILISALKMKRDCKSAQLVIDYNRLRRFGAYTLYINNKDIEVDAVENYRYGRPWSRPYPTGRHQN